jgi:cytoskeletal protein RodZ
MTVYEDEPPARRRGVGTRVLVLACAILAILGSFWSIVWFIRTYVEPPRVMMPAGLSLASRDSAPASAPTATMRRMSTEAVADPKPDAEAKPAEAQITPAQPTTSVARAFSVQESVDQSSASNAVADRWGPMGQPAAVPPPPPAPSPPPAVTATAPSEPPLPSFMTSITEKGSDEVIEGSVPAIEGPVPLPRRRPVVTAQRRNVEPPLPRPRPDGQVAPPPSVFTAVPPSDDRYPAQQ